MSASARTPLLDADVERIAFELFGAFESGLRSSP